MNTTKEYPVVVTKRFIEATRDSGYKSTAAAIAELVDNSLEAGATRVAIHLAECDDKKGLGLKVTISDNGTGMSPSVLRLALQFGGSTRFNSRDDVGRYGMGLPNSSLSQSRRVDVFSWTKPNAIWWSFLDVDEIASGNMTSVPKPKRVKLKEAYEAVNSPSGTIIMWSRCDRLNHKKVKTIVAKLHAELGRIFRRQIQNGKSITINGEVLKSVDPLCLHEGMNLVGASQYGSSLSYRIQVPATAKTDQSISTIYVTFSELPIDKWHSFSNEEKRKYGISKNAGVSILRSDREIDYGWFFMGGKRKENYDDWWRCEVRFGAELDELFGVTHTKQGIHPTDEIISVLAPDIGRIAHELNARVRRKFIQIKGSEICSEARSQAESRDYLLEPPLRKFGNFPRYGVNSSLRDKFNPKVTLPGLAYRIEHKVLKEVSFYIPLLCDREVVLLLNEDHPFYEQVYAPIAYSANLDIKVARQFLELLLLAAARAECGVRNKIEKACAGSLRESWSNVLAAFLG